MRFLAIPAGLAALHILASNGLVAAAIAVAMAVGWLSYRWVREVVLVAAFAIHLAITDQERAWVA